MSAATWSSPIGPYGIYKCREHWHLGILMHSFTWDDDDAKGGWWEKPSSYDVDDDQAGWEVVYDRTFADRRKMSTLVADHQRWALFIIGHQAPNGHVLQVWAPGHQSAFATWHASIVSCSHGCYSIAGYSNTFCLRHGVPWEDEHLVASLYDTSCGRFRPHATIVDPLDACLRGW